MSGKERRLAPEIWIQWPVITLVRGAQRVNERELTGLCSVRCRQTTGDSFDTLDVLCVREVCRKFSNNIMIR